MSKEKIPKVIEHIFVAAGETLERIHKYQADELAWREKFKADAQVLMDKYGAIDFRKGGGLRFAKRPGYDDPLWREADNKYYAGWFYPRMRTYAGKRVPGGAERRKELQAVGRNMPTWEEFSRDLLQRQHVPGGDFHITPNPYGTGGILHSHYSIGFKYVGDDIVLVTFNAPREETIAPLGCTQRLLGWEVAKMEWEAECAAYEKQKQQPTEEKGE